MWEDAPPSRLQQRSPPWWNPLMSCSRANVQQKEDHCFCDEKHLNEKKKNGPSDVFFFLFLWNIAVSAVNRPAEPLPRSEFPPAAASKYLCDFFQSTYESVWLSDSSRSLYVCSCCVFKLTCIMRGKYVFMWTRRLKTRQGRKHNAQEPQTETNKGWWGVVWSDE